MFSLSLYLSNAENNLFQRPVSKLGDDSKLDLEG